MKRSRTPLPARAAAMIGAFSLAAGLLAGCGEPELSEEAQEAEGSSNPTAETGSPAPGLPPDLMTGG